MEAIKFHKEPQLKNPSMVAAWPGMGGVAIIAARYLRDMLGAEEFGEIEPYDFFDLNIVPIEDNIVKKPEFPESKFYYWKNSKGDDLIVFISEAQPSMKSYSLANLVLDVAQKFGAKMACTFAAAPAHVYHAKKPRVLGVATDPALTSELLRHGVTPMSSGSISGMNGLLLGVARERDMKGVCLLGEIPIYITQMANPSSSKAVLNVLAEMLDIEIDMAGLDDWARKITKEIDENIDHLRHSDLEEAERLVYYFDRLKQQVGTEEVEAGELGEFSTEELLEEVEKFLKSKREKEGDN